jgi:site-specific recombinase XerD
MQLKCATATLKMAIDCGSHITRCFAYLVLYRSRRRKQPGSQHRSEPEGGLAPETLRAYFSTLSAFFSWAEAGGLLNGHQPMRNVQGPKAGHKEIRTLSDNQVGRLLALLNSPHIKKRTLCVAFSLMCRLGLRISEVCNARLSDIDLTQGSLLVRGKGKKQRRLPIRNDLEDILESYMTEVRPTTPKGWDGLLVSYVGKPLRPGPLRKSFARYAKRAGIVGTPRVLRHSFATKAVRSEVSPFVLMRLLGRGDIKTTMRYVHTNGFDDMAAALDKTA